MMIITDKGEEVKKELAKNGIESEVIGKVTDDVVGGETVLVKKDGSKKKIEHPEEDPFWRAFFELAKQVS
jgi:hydrogenase maturation factor